VSTRELIIPEGLENLYTEKGYAPGIRVGNMLYVSGMLGRDENLLVIKEPTAQFERVFENTARVLTVAAARSGSVGGMGCLVFGRAIAGFRF
jgi:enamine deaminase RidA (YjgF/YER057c/UK114 family)